MSGKNAWNSLVHEGRVQLHRCVVSTEPHNDRLLNEGSSWRKVCGNSLWPSSLLENNDCGKMFWKNALKLKLHIKYISTNVPQWLFQLLPIITPKKRLFYRRTHTSTNYSHYYSSLKGAIILKMRAFSWSQNTIRITCTHSVHHKGTHDHIGF